MCLKYHNWGRIEIVEPSMETKCFVCLGSHFRAPMLHMFGHLSLPQVIFLRFLSFNSLFATLIILYHMGSQVIQLVCTAFSFVCSTNRSFWPRVRTPTGRGAMPFFGWRCYGLAEVVQTCRNQLTAFAPTAYHWLALSREWGNQPLHWYIGDSFPHSLLRAS